MVQYTAKRDCMRFRLCETCINNPVFSDWGNWIRTRFGDSLCNKSVYDIARENNGIMYDIILFERVFNCV